MNGIAPKSVEHPKGSFNWVIEHYMRTPEFTKIGKIYKRNLSLEFERFRREHGHRMIKDLRPVHVEAIIAKKADMPAAANKLLKLMKRLCRFAVKRELIPSDPTFGIKGYATNPDGYHTWTEAR